MRAAISIPLADSRSGMARRPPGQALARRGISMTVLAWLVAYGGGLLGISVLESPHQTGFDLMVAFAFLIGAPVAGIAMSFSGIRKSLRALQMIVVTLPDRVESVIALVVGLSFFVIPVAVVTVVAFWAFMMPGGA